MDHAQFHRVTVLGTGLVGSAIVADLAKDANLAVTAVDANPAALERLALSTGVRTQVADLRAPGAIAGVVAGADLVVLAVPGFMGFESLRQVLEAGKTVVDISFFPEDAFLLDDLAKAKGVTAVVDCGVAPGMANIIAGYVESQLGQLESYLCYVGGLPKVRHWPYEYKAVFSPIDVIEEYTRPARFVEHGREVVRPALSGVELVNLPGVGTLESFNTDGLRSLIRTFSAPNMKEMTLRYPGHASLMAVLRESGFFSTEPLQVEGQSVRPLAMTAKLLFDHWKLHPGEEDFTVMRVVLEGQKDGRRLRYTYDLLDSYDRATNTTSMARTTGYTCTQVARQVLDGQFRQVGICPPEYVGRTPGCYQSLFAGLAARSIVLAETIEQVTSAT
ncbi:MAG: saccharopine dehydrogenase C-terminal domain-containing protein [Caldilineaceae bacterium]